MLADATTTVDVPTWLAIIAGLFGFAGTIGTAFAIVRQVAIKQSLSTIIEANQEIRAENQSLRDELGREREKRAELEGRLSVFVDQFAEKIVGAVVETWQRTHSTLTSKTTTEVTHQEVKPA